MDTDYVKYRTAPTRSYLPGSVRTDHPGRSRYDGPSGIWGRDMTTYKNIVKQMHTSTFTVQNGPSRFSYKIPRKDGITQKEALRIPRGGNVLRIVGSTGSEVPYGYTPGDGAADIESFSERRKNKPLPGEMNDDGSATERRQVIPTPAAAALPAPEPYIATPSTSSSTLSSASPQDKRFQPAVDMFAPGNDPGVPVNMRIDTLIDQQQMDIIEKARAKELREADAREKAAQRMLREIARKRDAENLQKMDIDKLDKQERKAIRDEKKAAAKKLAAEAKYEKEKQDLLDEIAARTSPMQVDEPVREEFVPARRNSVQMKRKRREEVIQFANGEIDGEFDNLRSKKRQKQMSKKRSASIQFVNGDIVGELDNSRPRKKQR